MSKDGLTHRSHWHFLAGLLGFAILWAVAAAGIGLAADEAYYWTWSKSLQWGYFDHAPMVAWLIRAGTTVFGDTAFGVRVLGLVSMLIAALALRRTVYVLSDKNAANLAAIVFCAVPMVSGNAVIITPDAPAMLFWSLALWALAERLASGNRHWWLVVGLCAGLGLLSKYNVLFLGAGLVLCIATSKELRRDVFSWQLWLGGIIAIILFMPVVVWNANHEWVSFIKQMGRIGQAKGYDPRFFPELLGAVFLLFHPVAIVMAVIAVARYFKARDFELSQAAHLAFTTSLPLMLYMAWHAQFARVEGNWPAPLCFALVLALAPLLKMASYDRLSKSLVPFGAVTAVIIFGYALSPVGFIRGDADKINQMRGWDTFGTDVLELASREKTLWIATSNYGTTASLRWAFRNAPQSLPIIQLTDRRRYTFESIPDALLLSQPALFIEITRFDSGSLADRFTQIEPLAPMMRGLYGKAGQYSAIRLSNPVGTPLSP